MDQEVKWVVVKKWRHFVHPVRTIQTKLRNRGIAIFLFCWVVMAGLYGCAALKEVREMESVTGPCKLECYEEGNKHANCLGYNSGLAASGAGGGACTQTRARYVECMNKCRLHHASWNGDQQTVRRLLEKGADVNMKLSSNGGTALMSASENGHTEIVKLLLEKGADVNVKLSASGTTALMLASWHGHTEIVKLLLEKGADVNIKLSSNGGTALMLASESGRTEIVKLLLEKGADVNMKLSPSGGTALMSASQNGHTEIVKLLREKGVDE